MKNRKILGAAIAVIVLFFFTSCDKGIRGQYTGKWDFRVVHRSGPYDRSEYDTVYYLGKITLGAAYNKLKIEYMENTKITLELDEYGNLTKDFEDPHEFAFGEFEGGGKVQIHLGWSALGGGNTYSIEGTKRERRGK